MKKLDKTTQARLLLNEALDHITSKPWDDPTLLHYRISKFLGLKPEYEDCIKTLDDEEGQ